MTRALTILLLFLVSMGIAQQRVTNGIGMEFVRISAGKMRVGEFKPPYPVPEDTVKGSQRPWIMWMGDGRGYTDEEFTLAREMSTRDASEGFEVTIAKDFYIGRFEVTQAQWEEVMGSNPSAFKHLPDADSLPVENVTWDEVQKFLKRLNKREKTKRYRLPTEFEWEYAARAGADKDIPWDQIQKSANLGKKFPVKIGTMNPNAWGLHDMLGNVWEWVSDYYNDRLFADPVPQRSGTEHVLKGASFTGDVKNATYMTHAGGPGNGWDVGFRVVMTVEK